VHGRVELQCLTGMEVLAACYVAYTAVQVQAGVDRHQGVDLSSSCLHYTLRTFPNAMRSGLQMELRQGDGEQYTAVSQRLFAWCFCTLRLVFSRCCSNCIPAGKVGCAIQ
jgi:hypothetical protein